MTPTPEALGQLVRKAWVDYCERSGDTKPSHIAPWEELDEWDKEADRCIGIAVAQVVESAAFQNGMDAAGREMRDMIMSAEEAHRRGAVEALTQVAEVVYQPYDLIAGKANTREGIAQWLRALAADPDALFAERKP